jgi:hypothetical protein
VELDCRTLCLAAGGSAHKWTLLHTSLPAIDIEMSNDPLFLRSMGRKSAFETVHWPALAAISSASIAGVSALISSAHWPRTATYMSSPPIPPARLLLR